MPNAKVDKTEILQLLSEGYSAWAIHIQTKVSTARIKRIMEETFPAIAKNETNPLKPKRTINIRQPEPEITIYELDDLKWAINQVQSKYKGKKSENAHSRIHNLIQLEIRLTKKFTG